MRQERLEALESWVERVARSKPRLYRAQLVALVIAAYIFLASVAALMLLGLVAAVVLPIKAFSGGTIKLSLLLAGFCGGVLWLIARAVWVRLHEPEGKELRREDAPELHALVDRLRAQLQSPPIRRVLLTGEVGAAVSLNPRLGVLGWHRATLMLGLPLMEALSPEEFTAVLAHEFGHIGRGRGRMDQWLFRTFRTWERIAEHSAQGKDLGSRAMGLVHNLYWPVLSAYSGVFARSQEFLADQTSVEVVGAAPASRALARIVLVDRWLDEHYWKPLRARAGEAPEPPADTVAARMRMVREPAPAAESVRWLREALARATPPLASHPSLRARLTALGVDLERLRLDEVPLSAHLAPPRSAAQQFLGARASALAAELGAEWAQLYAPLWKFQAATDRKRRELLQRPLQMVDGRPSVEDLLDRVDALESLDDTAAMEPLLRAALQLDPGCHAARGRLGALLLERDDPAGIELLERVAAESPVYASTALRALNDFHDRRGDHEQARAVRIRADQQGRELSKALKAWSKPRRKDAYAAEPLTEEQLRRLCEIFVAEPDIAEVGLVRKQVPGHSGVVGRYLVMRVRRGFWRSFMRTKETDAEIEQRILDRITDVLSPGPLRCFADRSEHARVVKRVLRVPGARIYLRPKKS
ncbi:MAG: M48 family metalloprotease [Phycisphaerales bacterium]